MAGRARSFLSPLLGVFFKEAKSALCSAASLVDGNLLYRVFGKFFAKRDAASHNQEDDCPNRPICPEFQWHEKDSEADIDSFLRNCIGLSTADKNPAESPGGV